MAKAYFVWEFKLCAGRGRGSQVHEHSGGALAAVFEARINFVMEPVVVRLVLLAVSVVQHLHALAVFHRQEAHVADAPLNPPEHLRGRLEALCVEGLWL